MKPWAEGDVEDFFPIARDPLVMRCGGAPWSNDEVLEFVARQMVSQDRNGFCMWKLVLKETGELTGFCGLQPLVGTEEIEVGWWLASRCWHKGLATEAARRALEFAFAEAGLERVVAVVLPENEKSVAVTQRLGMRYVGRVQHKGIELLKYEVRKEGWV